MPLTFSNAYKLDKNYFAILNHLIFFLFPATTNDSFYKLLSKHSVDMGHKGKSERFGVTVRTQRKSGESLRN